MALEAGPDGSVRIVMIWLCAVLGGSALAGPVAPLTVGRASQRAALPSSWRRAAVSTATSGTRLGSDTTVIRSVPA